jgi:uncharacterized protein
VCPHRAAEAREPFPLCGREQVYSYATVYDAPAGFESQVLYTVAVIKLDEGPSVTAQLTDVERDQVQIGLPAEMVTRVLRSNAPRGTIEFGFKCQPSMSVATV